MNTEAKTIKKVNSREELEDRIDIGDAVEVCLNQNKNLMVYNGIVDRIYHSFLWMSGDKSFISHWMSEIQHLGYKNGAVVFNNFDRKLDIYSHGSKEYEAKKKILE